MDALLSTQLKADQKHHREMLMKLLHSIKYLARQGLPLRGHHEDSLSFEGNLYQLLLLHATYCPEMTAWLSRREYISPDIVNELIRMMGQSLLRTLLREIRSSLSFAIWLTKQLTCPITNSCRCQFVGSMIVCCS